MSNTVETMTLKQSSFQLVNCCELATLYQRADDVINQPVG